MKKKSSKPNSLTGELKYWDDYYQAFLKLLPKVSDHHDQRDIFCDACRIFCLSLRGAVTIDCKEKDDIEEEYQRYVTKYGNEGMQKISILFSYVVEALELKRQDFLGHIYEELSATNKQFGQYLTPDSVARMMALITFQGEPPKHGKIVKFNDCSCGAGALLIEAAEAFITQGGRQGDLILFGEDLDPTACYITYTQFSLLGYPAVVTHQDTLAMKVYEGPWYTFGYFAHAMPMRLLCKNMDDAYAEKHQEVKKEDCWKVVKAEDEVPHGKEDDATLEVNVRELVQSEFKF